MQDQFLFLFGGAVSLIFNIPTFEAYLSFIQIDFSECLACQHIATFFL